MPLWIRRDFVAEYVRQPNRLLDLTLPEEQLEKLAALARIHEKVLKKLGVSAVVPCRQTNGTGPWENHSSTVRIIDPLEIPEASQAGLADSPPDGSGEMKSAARSNIVLLKLGQ
jgi:hypothetical protein